MPLDWLIEIRKNKEFTQLEVAIGAKISRNYLSEIENGLKRPSVTVAQAIGEFLGFDWVIFFEGKSRETQHTA